MKTSSRTIAAALLVAALGGALSGCKGEEGAAADSTKASGTDNRATEAPVARPLDEASTKPAQDPKTQNFRGTGLGLAISRDPTELDIKGPVQPDAMVAKLIQTLVGFHHPKACVVSPDGKFLYVTNSVVGDSGFVVGKGYISQLQIQEDGRLKMLKARWVEGLTAPQGLAFLTKATKRFPAGTLFVCTGMTHQADEAGAPVDDHAKCKPGLTIIDPEQAKVIATMPMGPKTAVARSLYHPVLAPVGLAIDPDGDLYIGDRGHTGKFLQPETQGRPGILRIKQQNIDAYASDKMEGNVSFVSVRHEPNGVYYCKLDDGLYWTTCDGQGPAGGAVYRMPRRQFPQDNMVENVVGDIGPLEGMIITPIRQQVASGNRWGGTLLVSRAQGDLMFVTRKKLDSMQFLSEDQPVFSTPADMKLHTLPNGWNIIYVPETDPPSIDEGKQRVRVVLMPAGM